MNEWILLQEGFLVYLALSLALLGGAIGLPIPEDIPLIAAGIAVHRGSVDLTIIFLVCYGSIILGDLIIFWIGRKFGSSIFSKRWFRAKIPPSKIRKVKLSIEKRSLLMIFIARHLFYLRTVTFLTCGAVKMRPRRFIIADAAAALVSVPLMMGIGYVASENYEVVLQSMRKVERLSMIVFAVLGIGVVWWFLKKKSPSAKKKKDSTQTEK